MKPDSKIEIESKLTTLAESAEVEFQKESKLSVHLKEQDATGETLVNRCTDKDGNEGYYIVLTTIDEKGDTYQKIQNYKVEQDTDKDWFKLLTY